MSLKFFYGLALAALLAVAAPIGSAKAQLNVPVPSNAYIVFGGLDWAWGDPCPYSGGCYASGNLTYQGTQGWALPTAAQMALVDAVDAIDPSAFANLFVSTTGNVPSGGTDPLSGAYFASSTGQGGSCASAYFTAQATWCDWSDGSSGWWAGSQLAVSGGATYFAEQLYVRGSTVPEPASFAIFGVAVIGLGAALRRRRA